MTTRETTQLLDLPVEVLADIVSNVRQNGTPITSNWPRDGKQRWTSMASQLDLARIAASCKTLNTITNPILYYAPSPLFHAKLLRTIADRPDLVTLVRALDLNELLHQDPANKMTIMSEFSCVEAAALRLNIGLTRYWFKVIKEGRCSKGAREGDRDPRHLIFDMLLALVADNLVALRYTGLGDSSRDPFAGEIPVRSPLGGHLHGITFPRLSYLAMTNISPRCANSGRSDEFLSMCPNLESLWLDRVAYIPSTRLDLTKLRWLRMTMCPLKITQLRHILGSCRNLEAFECTSPTFLTAQDRADFSMQDLVHLLRPMASTIRHLILVHGQRTPYPWQQCVLPGPLQSLADFQCLETVVLDPFRKFVATERLFDLLPRSLRYLAIPTNLNRSKLPPLGLLKVVKDDGFPALQKVALTHYHHVNHHDSLDEVMERGHKWDLFTADLAAAGVQCVDYDNPETIQASPTYNFVPGKDFVQPNNDNWWASSAWCTLRTPLE